MSILRQVIIKHNKGLKIMTPLEEIRQELADHVYKLLDQHYPRYRVMNDKKIAKQLEIATQVGLVRWAIMCAENNQSKAARRLDITRNKVAKLLIDSHLMREEKKFDLADRHLGIK